jgi:hypothetical protein
MKSIIDFILSLVSPAKATKTTPNTELADALARDVQALESGGDPALKKKILQQAKRLAGQIGGPEMIVPQYAAAVGSMSTLLLPEQQLTILGTDGRDWCHLHVHGVEALRPHPHGQQHFVQGVGVLCRRRGVGDL